jgi:antitoxin component HigA of HigAB toxin-antitoxin module
MIIGDCPYCNASMSNPVADLPLPRWEKLTAECCRKTVWLFHSRVNPKAYTEEGFAKDFDIDEATKSIKRRVTDSGPLSEEASQEALKHFRGISMQAVKDFDSGPQIEGEWIPSGILTQIQAQHVEIRRVIPVTPITTAEEHTEALAEIEILMGLNPIPGSDLAQRLSSLAEVVEAYEKMKYPIGEDKETTPLTRKQIVANARRQLEEIKELLADTEHWNTHVRQPHEEPIDPDPDGAVSRIRSGLESLLVSHLVMQSHLPAPERTGIQVEGVFPTPVQISGRCQEEIIAPYIDKPVKVNGVVVGMINKMWVEAGVLRYRAAISADTPEGRDLLQRIGAFTEGFGYMPLNCSGLEFP